MHELCLKKLDVAPPDCFRLLWWQVDGMRKLWLKAVDVALKEARAAGGKL